MKVSAFLKFIIFGILIWLIPASGWAQKNPFDSKKHKDTILDKSALNATAINASLLQNSSLLRQPNRNISNKISSKTKSDNLRISNNIDLVISKESGLPIFISTPGNTTSSRLNSSVDIRNSCYEYMNSLSYLTKISNSSQDFSIKNIQTDALGKTHVKLFQKYKGIKVYSSEVSIHFNKSNIAEILNGNYHIIRTDLDVKPVFSTQSAINKAITDIASKTTYRELTEEEKKLLNYSSPEIDTIIYENIS